MELFKNSSDQKSVENINRTYQYFAENKDAQPADFMEFVTNDFRENIIDVEINWYKTMIKMYLLSFIIPIIVLLILGFISFFTFEKNIYDTNMSYFELHSSSLIMWIFVVVFVIIELVISSIYGAALNKANQALSKVDDVITSVKTKQRIHYDDKFKEIINHYRKNADRRTGFYGGRGYGWCGRRNSGSFMARNRRISDSHTNLTYINAIDWSLVIDQYNHSIF